MHSCIMCGAAPVLFARLWSEGRLAAGKGFFLAIGTVLSIGGWLIGSSLELE